MYRIFITLIVSALFFSLPSHAAKKTIGIVVFDGVLTSDVTAPAEVFGAATKQSWFTDYDVKMIGITKSKTITTAEGLTLQVDGNIYDEHSLTVLLLPSSYDMDPLLKNKELIQFIQTQSSQVDWLASNCSGAYLLSEAGLLDGKKATTWAGGEADLQKQYPNVNVQFDTNYVIDGNIITSNGSLVSYTAATKLLSLMSSESLANEVFDALQMGRLITQY